MGGGSGAARSGAAAPAWWREGAGAEGGHALGGGGGHALSPRLAASQFAPHAPHAVGSGGGGGGGSAAQTSHGHSRKRPREAPTCIPAPALSFNQVTGGPELFRCTLCGLDVANRNDGSLLLSDVAVAVCGHLYCTGCLTGAIISGLPDDVYKCRRCGLQPLAYDRVRQGVAVQRVSVFKVSRLGLPLPPPPPKSVTPPALLASSALLSSVSLLSRLKSQATAPRCNIHARTLSHSLSHSHSLTQSLSLSHTHTHTHTHTLTHNRACHRSTGCCQRTTANSC